MENYFDIVHDLLHIRSLACLQFNMKKTVLFVHWCFFPNAGLSCSSRLQKLIVLHIMSGLLYVEFYEVEGKAVRRIFILFLIPAQMY